MTNILLVLVIDPDHIITVVGTDMSKIKIPTIYIVGLLSAYAYHPRLQGNNYELIIAM